MIPELRQATTCSFRLMFASTVGLTLRHRITFLVTKTNPVEEDATEQDEEGSASTSTKPSRKVIKAAGAPGGKAAAKKGGRPLKLNTGAGTKDIVIAVDTVLLLIISVSLGRI